MLEKGLPFIYFFFLTKTIFLLKAFLQKMQKLLRSFRQFSFKSIDFQRNCLKVFAFTFYNGTSICCRHLSVWVFSFQAVKSFKLSLAVFKDRIVRSAKLFTDILISCIYCRDNKLSSFFFYKRLFPIFFTEEVFEKLWVFPFLLSFMWVFAYK